MAVWSVVLAAGEGRRMGGNKGLVSFRGRPLLRHVMSTIRRSRVAGCVVVVGSQGDELAPMAEEAGATVVRNPRWRDGQTSSIKLGVAGLPDEAEAFLIQPVDHGLVESDDLDRLVVAWEEAADPGLIARPVCGDAFGHPVLFGRSYAEDFAKLEEGEPGSAVYRANRESVKLVTVTNQNIAVDLDTPEDLARFE